jgi:hypothetical protein
MAGSIVAPVTALTTLLFYFGYVSTRQEYLFFGLDVDTIGLTTQDFVMRSGQPLLVPLIVLPLATAGVILGARRLRPWLVGHQRVAEIIGSGLLVIGVLLLVAYQFVGDWPYYLVATPLVLALGGMVAAYAAGLRHAPVPARVALWLVVAAGVFWATTTVAQWSGAGLALEQAQHLDELPQVVVDTPERLYLTSPDIAETALPSVQGQKFAYRYRGWRLLIQKGDRMFLVPCQQTAEGCPWRPGSPTVLLAAGSGYRIQFYAP